MVFDKQWFAKYNNTLCWFANHAILKYWFRRLLRIEKDVKWNDKIEEIMPNAFTYGKKLVLQDCIKIKGEWFPFDVNNVKHRRLKSRCEIKKKLCNQQTTDFRTHEKFGKRLYYGLKPLWYLIHFWDWSTAMQPKLNLGFDTLTAYCGTNAMDGTVGYAKSNTTWSYIRTANGNLCANGSTLYADEFVYLLSGENSGMYSWHNRGVVQFDTSSLTLSATISNVELSLYVIYKNYNDTNSPAYNIYNASIGSNTTLAKSDYENCGTTAQSDTAKTPNDITTNQYNTWTFNNTGKGNINKTGISDFCIREKNYDVDNSALTWVYYTTMWRLRCSTSGETGTGQDPKLVITYTSPGPANIKTYKGLASASVKTLKGLAIASVKTKKGLA